MSVAGIHAEPLRRPRTTTTTTTTIQLTEGPIDPKKELKQEMIKK